MLGLSLSGNICSGSKHLCDKNAICRVKENDRNAYKCLCKEGFRRTGKKCLGKSVQLNGIVVMNDKRTEINYGVYIF